MHAESAGNTTKARPACGRRLLICALVATALAGPLTPGRLAAQSAAKRARLPQGLPALPRVEEDVLVHTLSGFALQGFDPVGYHSEGQALSGVAAHEAILNGVVWRFSSGANRDAFLATPEIYLPAFDGFDAEGVARQRLVDADPTIFAVIEDKLYLFKTEEHRNRFREDPALRREASENWPVLRLQVGG